MATDSKVLDAPEKTINSKKVGEIVIDALQEILPHVRGASNADFLIAFAVMIKSTLAGMELSDKEKDQAKALFDRMYPQVLVGHLATTSHISTMIH